MLKEDVTIHLHHNGPHMHILRVLFNYLTSH